MGNMIRLLGFIAYVCTCMLWADEGNNECQSANFILDKQFESGNFHHCQVLSMSHFTLTLQPENKPINPSPWYAFRATKLGDGNPPLTVTIRYPHYKFRYWPKVSSDGKQWSAIAKDQVTVDKSQSQFTVTLAVNQPQLWVAAQPLLTNASYQQWLTTLSQNQPQFVLSDFGLSVQGRLLQMLQVQAQASNPTIVLLGRQHPPEITGAMAMLPFVERLAKDDPLANQFRQQFNLLIIPNLNPDGVAAGHWRHNANGVDLNRDWGPFTQPETQQVKRVLDGIAKVSEVWGMLDFHSTWKDVMYTQEDQQMHKLTGFVANWLQQLDAAYAGISFKRQASHNTDKATTKSYFFERFATPAITFELDDESDPQAIAEVATIAAELYMQNMLHQRELLKH